MLLGSLFLALATYLLPLVLLGVMRARRDRTLQELALDPPLFVAIDLLMTYALARLMRLEWAILASRVIWLAVAAGVLLWKRRTGDKPALPAALDRHAGAIGVVGAIAGASLSLWYTRPWAGPHAAVRACMPADSRWHVPLVASLQGQKIPFHNIYQPGLQLSYHYAGDVLAAQLKTFSLDVMHSSLALAVAHATMFALMGLCIAWWMSSWGFKSMWLGAAAVWGVLLAGPGSLLRPDSMTVAGYNFISFLRVSFRPHVPIAGLMIIGIVGSLLASIQGDLPPRPWLRTRLPLFAAMVMLGVTEVASFAVLGVALAATWLVWTDLDKGRWRSLAALVVLGASPLLLGLVFPGALSQSQVHPTLIAPRSPGYHHVAIALGTGRGWSYLICDIAPVLVLTVAGVIRSILRPSRAQFASLVFLCTVVLVSLFALTSLNLGRGGEENHRFWIGTMIVAPMCGLAWLGRWPRPRQHEGFIARVLRRFWRRWRAPIPALTVLVGVGLALPAASTLQELSSVVPRYCPRTRELYAPYENLYAINCRHRFGTQLGTLAIPRYIERPLFYRFTGCDSSYAVAPKPRYWKMAVRYPEFGLRALRKLDKSVLGPNQSLEVVCGRGRSRDPICAKAVSGGNCHAAGIARICLLSPEARRELLGEPRRQRPRPAGR